MMPKDADLVHIVETMYQLDGTDTAWLTRVTEAVRSILDCHHMGIVSNFYDCPSPYAYRPDRTIAYDVPFGIAQGFFDYVKAPHPTFISDTILSRPWWFVRRVRRAEDVGPAFDRYRNLGIVDKLTLNALEPDGRGCCFGSFHARVETASRAWRAALTRLAAHLATAHRLRRRFDAPVPMHAAELILDADGRVVHVETSTCGALDRNGLEDAAKTMIHARLPRGRADSARAVGNWQALVCARWTLIDHFERNGRRYILAVENRSRHSGVDLFTARERDVVARALLGRANKEIAYELGLASSTVRVLISRACAKVGAVSRAQLLDRARGLNDGVALQRG